MKIPKRLEFTNIADTDSDDVEMYMYGVIGDYPGEISALEVLDMLKAAEGRKSVIARVHSPGGSIFEADPIYNGFKRLSQSGTKVIFEVDGLAASAMSYIIQAGDERRIAANGRVMIHRSHGGTIGDRDAHAKTVEILDGFDENIAGVYASRSNRKPSTWLAMMTRETWMNAEQAVKERLADSVIPNKGVSAHFSPEVMARFSKLKPERIAAMLADDAGPDDPPADLNSEDGDAPESPLNVAQVVVVADVLASLQARVDSLQV